MTTRELIIGCVGFLLGGLLVPLVSNVGDEGGARPTETTVESAERAAPAESAREAPAASAGATPGTAKEATLDFAPLSPSTEDSLRVLVVNSGDEPVVLEGFNVCSPGRSSLVNVATEEQRRLWYDPSDTGHPHPYPPAGPFSEASPDWKASCEKPAQPLRILDGDVEIPPHGSRELRVQNPDGFAVRGLAEPASGEYELCGMELIARGEERPSTKAVLCSTLQGPRE